jgi:hypothetical protein
LHLLAEVIPLEGVTVSKPVFVLVSLFPSAGGFNRLEIRRIRLEGLRSLSDFMVRDVGKSLDHTDWRDRDRVGGFLD